MLWKSYYRVGVRVNSSFENDCIIFHKQEPIFPRATGYNFPNALFFCEHLRYLFPKARASFTTCDLPRHLPPKARASFAIANNRGISYRKQEPHVQLRSAELPHSKSKSSKSSWPVEVSPYTSKEHFIATNSARTSIDTITYLDVVFWSNGVHHDLTYFYILTYWNTSNSNQIFLEPKHFSLTIRMFIFVKLIPINHKHSDAFFCLSCKALCVQARQNRPA